MMIMLRRINIKQLLVTIIVFYLIVSIIVYSHLNWKRIVYKWLESDNEDLYKNLTINDILITVKTSGIYEDTRLKDIIQTWYTFAESQIYFVSDKNGTRKFNKSNFIYTDCGEGHDAMYECYCYMMHFMGIFMCIYIYNILIERLTLCCKFGTELSLYFKLKRQFKWYCHVDDDNYLHIPNLVSFLSNYNHTEDWYLGRVSWRKPVVRKYPKKYLPKPATFWFGTLGAGVCLSNATMYKLIDIANDKSFTKGCEKMILPDDMYLGYMLGWVNKINLTNSSKFNHHLDKNQFKTLDDIHSRVTFGFGKAYDKYFDKSCNCSKQLVVEPGIATLFKNDNYKIRSLHCLLFPNTEYCKKMFIKAFESLNNFKDQFSESNETKPTAANTKTKQKANKNNVANRQAPIKSQMKTTKKITTTAKKRKM